MSPPRCPDCDLPLATELDAATTAEGAASHLCWRRYNAGACVQPRVDWRARALEAEAAARTYRAECDHLRRDLDALRGKGAAGEHRALVRAEAMRAVVFGTPAAVAVTQAEDALRRVLAAEDARAGRVPR